MDKLNFFTPVTYLPVPDALFNKSLTTIAKELADEFFNLKDGPRAFVVDINKNVQTVQLVTCQTSRWKTALKIALMATPVFPLMLLIKLCARSGTTLNEATFPLPKTDRDELEPIFYQNHTLIKREEIDHRYAEICKKMGIVYKDATPLQRHALFFADEDGNISQKSIQHAFERLHSNKIISYIIASRIYKGVINVMKITSPSFSINDITKAMHPSDTTVFTRSGDYDAKKFESMIEEFAGPNSWILSAENIKKLIKANHSRDTGKTDADIGGEASDGEFRIMFNLFSDCALIDRYGNATQAITPGRLKSLYTEGPLLFEEVAASS